VIDFSQDICNVPSSLFMGLAPRMQNLTGISAVAWRITVKHHRSQRHHQLPEGMSLYEHLQRLGLNFLRIQPCDSR
jgi:hypothetical protein